jgi:stage II sporulation protein D
MKNMILALICFSFFSQLHAAITPVASPLQIRVRIAANPAHVRIRSANLKIYQLKGGIAELVDYREKPSEWDFKCVDGKIFVTEFYSPKIKKIREWRENLSIRSSMGFLYFEGQPYRDELRIYSKNSRCEVVNLLSLEKYLNGLINAEFSSKWNEESIEAQAVAARTYAYYKIQEIKKKKVPVHYDLDASTNDQVYNGSLPEDLNASRAVQKTEGVILTTGSEKLPCPIKAYYHSTCGGRTQLPEFVWGTNDPGFKRSVNCPYCVSSPRYHWQLELRTNEISHLILQSFENRPFPNSWPKNSKEILKMGSLMDVWIKNMNPSGRVSQLMMVWRFGKKIFEFPASGVQFRDWVGTTRLRSTSFRIISHSRPSRWRFEGQGSGHGVGMCQWGAKTMGEKGFGMAEILKYYYPDAILRKLW